MLGFSSFICLHCLFPRTEQPVAFANREPLLSFEGQVERTMPVALAQHRASTVVAYFPHPLNCLESGCYHRQTTGATDPCPSGDGGTSKALLRAFIYPAF